MNSPRRTIPAVLTTVFAVAALTATGTAPPAAAAGIPDSAGDPWAGGPVSTVGKVIWEVAGEGVGMCSGAIVDAPNGSVVATAAHCVSSPDDPQVPADAWFVPAYDHDVDSYQEIGWKIESFHLPQAWDVTQQTEDILHDDYAFLTVEQKQGVTLQRVHGANQLDFAPIEEGAQVVAFGYPATDPYDGESLHYCAGQTTVLREGDSAQVNVGGLVLDNCALTQGSSGGPWLQGFDPADGSGTLVAVMSVGNAKGQVVGRPYPAEARELYAGAAR